MTRLIATILLSDTAWARMYLPACSVYGALSIRVYMVVN